MRHNGSSLRRHKRGTRPVSDINLTSLLDVTFVLLIAFIIMAPALKYGVEIDLPAVPDGAQQLSTNDSNSATITITRTMAGLPGQVHDRTVMLNDDVLPIAQLESRLRDLNRAAEGRLAVEVNADRDIPYEAFVQVVAALRRAGIEGVGLPVDDLAR